MKFLVTLLIKEYDDDSNQFNKYYQELLVDIGEPDFYQKFKKELKNKHPDNECILFNCNTVPVYDELETSRIDI